VIVVWVLIYTVVMSVLVSVMMLVAVTVQRRRGTLVVDSAGLAPGYVPPSASLAVDMRRALEDEDLRSAREQRGVRTDGETGAILRFEDVVVGDYISDIQAELDRIDPPDNFEIPHTIMTDEEWERE
jgi:hypothetical protein